MDDEKKIAVVSCYFQHNYGSMLQAYATQRVLDKLGYDNETIDICGFSGEIRKAKLIFFIKAAFTSDILFSKLGRVKTVLARSGTQSLKSSGKSISGCLPSMLQNRSWKINVGRTILRFW